MRAFKGGPIPKPLVHGVLEASESYSWSPGIPLGGAGSFPLELQGLTAISGNVKYYRTVGPFFERVTSELNARKTFPVFLSKDPQVVGLAPMNIAFVANLLRTHLGRKTRITDELIKVVFSLLSEKALKNLMEITNTTSGRFDSKFCQLVPVLGEFEPSKFAEKLMEKCMALADERLPYASAKIRQNYLEVDDQEFAFDSSLIEYYLLKGDYLRELPYHKYLRTMECGNNILCGLYEQKGSIVKRDFLAPEALSRWLKLLLLDGLKLSYSGFVLNEVGHIIPVYSGPE
jgi:hypothetical protein